MYNIISYLLLFISFFKLSVISCISGSSIFVFLVLNISHLLLIVGKIMFISDVKRIPIIFSFGSSKNFNNLLLADKFIFSADFMK